MPLQDPIDPTVMVEYDPFADKVDDKTPSSQSSTHKSSAPKQTAPVIISSSNHNVIQETPNNHFNSNLVRCPKPVDGMAANSTPCTCTCANHLQATSPHDNSDNAHATHGNNLQRHLDPLVKKIEELEKKMEKVLLHLLKDGDAWVHKTLEDHNKKQRLDKDVHGALEGGGCMNGKDCPDCKKADIGKADVILIP